MKEKNETGLEIIDAMPQESVEQPVDKKKAIRVKADELAAMEKEIAALKEQIEMQKRQMDAMPEYTQRTELQKKIAAMKEDGLTEISGVFRNIENPGDFKEFAIRRFRGEPLTKYKLYDGVYTSIPKYVGEHINKQGKVAIHKRILGDDGQPTKVLDKYDKMFEFVSPELMQVEEVKKSYINARVG